MALKISKGRTFPIGIDLGSSVVKLAQLRQEEGQLDLLAAGSLPVPPALRDKPAKRYAFFSQAIRKVMRGHPFKGRQCVVSMPAGQTLVQHVKIPRTAPDQIEATLRRELQGKLPYDAATAILRYVVAGEAADADGKGKLEVIAVCVSQADLQHHLAMCRKAKLDIVGVNIESCAIVECFGRLFRRATDQARTILYIDLGATSTQVVFAHGNRMVFSRNLGQGSESLDALVAEEFDLPRERAHVLRLNPAAEDAPEAFSEAAMHEVLSGAIEGLGQDLMTCLRYYESVFRSQGVERAIFLGGGAYDKRLCQMLAQHVNLPAQIGDPLVRVNRASTGDADAHEPLPDWAVAVGLSLGADAA